MKNYFNDQEHLILICHTPSNFCKSDVFLLILAQIKTFIE